MKFVPFIIPFLPLMRILRRGTIWSSVSIMDKQQQEVIEQIAKELYASFKMEYDSYSWRGYQSWGDLHEPAKQFWIDQVTIVGEKFIRIV
jgi:hypothetical protein